MKELVELHGGRVWAESEGLGHGTTVPRACCRSARRTRGDEEPLLESRARRRGTLGRSIAAMEAELSHHGELHGEDRLAELARNVERSERTRERARRGGGGRSSARHARGAGRRGQRRHARLLAHLLGRRFRVRVGAERAARRSRRCASRIRTAS